MWCCLQLSIGGNGRNLEFTGSVLGTADSIIIIVFANVGAGIEGLDCSFETCSLRFFSSDSSGSVVEPVEALAVVTVTTEADEEAEIRAGAP